MFRYIIAWFPMLVLAVLNGAARDYFYKNKYGDLRAHQISTFTLMILFTIFVYLLNLFWPFTSEFQALIVGVTWVGMTIVFEFGFGHYIMKNPWESLLIDYNIFKGHLWGLFLLFLLFLPWLIYIIFNK